MDVYAQHIELHLKACPRIRGAHLELPWEPIVEIRVRIKE